MKLKMLLKNNYSIIFILLLYLLILIKNALLVGFMHHSNHFGYHLFYGASFIGFRVFLELFFITFIFSFSLFFKKKGRYIYPFILYITILIFSLVDMIYCRCFQGAPSAYWLFKDTGGEVEGNNYFLDPSIYVTFLDILFFIDLPIVIFMLIYGFKKELFTYNKYNSPVICSASFALLLIGSVILPKESVASTNTEKQVASYTAFGYHLIDIKDSITINKKAKITNKTLTNYENYQQLLKDDELNATDNLNASGVLKDSNLVFLQLEAIESFLIGSKINGKFITPNINKLLDNSYRFDLYEQVKNGNSSDCDILMMTGMLPTNKPITTVHFRDSEYHSLAEELKKENYNTLYINASKFSEWGYQNVETKSIGFDKDIYDIPGDKRTVGYVADEHVLDLAYNEILKLKDNKFYTHIVLASSHFPYPKQSEFFALDTKGMGRVGNYINWAHYVDKCIGDFVNKLDKDGILDNTTIVVTGDHGGIHKYAPHLANKEAKKYSFIGNSSDYTVPYVIYNKKLSGKRLDVIAGQVDALPSLAYLFDLKFNYKNGRIFMGRNLFKTNLNYAYLANGILKGKLTKKEKKILSKCYDLSDTLIRGYYFNND